MTARACAIATLFPACARDGQIFHGWGLGPNAGPARYGWWVRWPSGRLDYLAASYAEAEYARVLRDRTDIEYDEFVADVAADDVASIVEARRRFELPVLE